jgi:trimeric autotransporter adhesin
MLMANLSTLLIGLLLVGCASSLAIRAAGSTTADSSGAFLYVDAVTGNDSNPGTSARPLRTVTRAVEKAVANSRRDVSSTIVIQPGTYREAINLGAAAQQSLATISIRAVTPGTVIISGEDIWGDWKPDMSETGTYSHSWPFQWGACATPQSWPNNLAPIVLRREMISANNQVLHQVLSRSELTDSSFFVDDAAGAVIIRPPANTDMMSAQIAVAVRPKLFESHGYNNLVLSGLTFTKAASCPPAAAVAIYGGTGDHIENVTASWNSWAGISLNNIANAIVDHLSADNNGASGLLGYKVKGSLLDDVETSGNNWRGIAGNFHDFELAGAKFLRTHDTQFVNFRASENKTFGLWFDTDDARIMIKNSSFSRNLFYGVFLEANQGPITIQDSKFCENGAEGVRIQNSDHVTLSGNLFYANQIAQIFVDGRMSARDGKDWETSQSFSAVGHNVSILGNTFVAIDLSQVLFGTSQSSPDNSRSFFATLSSDGNTFYHTATTQVLQYDAGGINHRARNLDLDSWRSSTGQDQHSSFVQPVVDAASVCVNP